jgi:hypothetical protein
MRAAPRLPENIDGFSYLYISLCDPTPVLNLRYAHAANSAALVQQRPFKFPSASK